MFPVNDSTLQADALGKQVLPHYRIGTIAWCRFHVG